MVVLLSMRGRKDAGPVADPHAANDSSTVVRRSGADLHDEPAAAQKHVTIAKGGAEKRDGKKLIDGAWGTHPGEFGHRPADESNPEGPMGLVAGNDGKLYVLDQANARVQIYGADGKLAQSIAIGPDTAQDLATADDGRVAVLDRVHEGEVITYGADGQTLGSVTVSGGPIPEAGGATGVFIDASGTWIEREHGEIVHVAGPDGKSDPDRGTQPGRPTRDALYYVNAAVVDKLAGTARVRLFDHDARLVWQQTVTFPATILNLALLDSDRTGHVYVAAEIAEESGTTLTNEQLIVVRLDEPTGVESGAISIPPLTSADETFRPLSVADDGTVYEMIPGPSGVQVLTFTF